MAPRKTSIDNDVEYLLRLPSTELAQLHELARSNERSTAGELRVMIREALAKRVQAALDSRVA